MLKITENQVQKLKKEVVKGYPDECCGLLIGSRKKREIWEVRLCSNVETLTPNKRFELNPAAHLKIQKDIREKGFDILGCYHSHPNGTVSPSKRDFKFAYSDWFYLIIAVDEKKCFEYALYKTGDERFEEVSLEVVKPT